MTNTAPSVTPAPISNSYQIFPFFTGSDSACESAVYFLPPSFTYKQPTTFTSQYLFNSSSGTTTGTYANSDFKFSLAAGAVTVTLLANNMWACAAAARTQLMCSFVDFLQNVESQFELTGVLIPGATAIIGQRIADYMPAPPLETLFYRYSLSPGTSTGTVPYVDLRPGMRLRVETQASQFLTPGSPLNGYVGAGSFAYHVNSVAAPSGAGRVVTFDPFLGTIRTPSVTGGSTSPVVASGLVDLMPFSGQRPYWRLFYPQSISAPTQPGDLSTTDNVSLVGAQTLGQLNAATPQSPACPASKGGATSATPNVTAIFLGRAVVVPEIPIWISAYNQTSLEYVPVGTTLNNIAERYAALPLNTQQPQFASVKRPTTAATNTTASVTPFTKGLPGGTLPPGMFDIPLIAGDSVTLSLQ